MVQNAGSWLKTRQNARRKRVEKTAFTYFLTNIFARTERKIERDRKTKDNNLSFRVDG